MGSKRMTKVRGKIDARTATKDEYRLLRHTERLNGRRDEGVRLFWEQERERILNGQTPSRSWSSEQRATILHGDAAMLNGKKLQGRPLPRLLNIREQN